MSDPVPGRFWIDDDEVDGVEARAELTDVDEVAVVIELRPGKELLDDVILWLDRVHAIALAGQIAAAASASQTDLPHGHGVAS